MPRAPRLAKKSGVRGGLFALAFAAMGFAGAARSQELMRDSLAGAGAVERQPSLEEQNYNIKVGPVNLLLSAYTGFEYSDNINYSEVHRVSDVLVRGGFNVEAIWTITKLNTLDVTLGLGFLRYINHPSATDTNLVIAPGSQVAFDLYIADIFRVNFHDRFELRQDPIDEAALSGVTDFSRFTNTAGVTLIADFNRIVVTLGYDHFNYVSLNSNFDYLNRSAEQFLGSVVFTLGPRTFLGIEGTAAITDYDQNFQNNSVGGTIGGYFDITFNPYLRLITRGGFQTASFDTGGLFGDTSQLNTGYGSVTLENQLNAYVTQTLSFGRETDLGITSNYIEVNYVRWNAAWKIIKDFTLGTDLFFEHDTESGGPIDETLNRYGGGFSLGYNITNHLSAILHYAYINKDSDRAFQSYYQNRVGVDLNYRF